MRMPFQDSSIPSCDTTSATQGVPAPLPGWARMLLRLYAPVAMVIGLGSLALICLLWYPFAMVAGMLPLSGSWRRRIGRGVIHAGTRGYVAILRGLCFVRLDARALQPLRSESSLVIVANHPSLLDAVLFMSHLPNTVCVMKAALQSNVLYGAATRLAHYVGNASPLHMIRHACEELEQGAHMVIFPEGTRTTQWPVNSCSAASVIMAQHAHVPIQEVFIKMSTPYLGKHWGLLRPPVLPLTITLALGSRIAPSGQPSAAVARQIHQDMVDHLTSATPASHA